MEQNLYLRQIVIQTTGRACCPAGGDITDKNTAKQLYLPQTDGKLASNPCHVDDHIMKQALLIVDVQPSFPISMEILHGIRELSAILPSVATVERHDESVTPFEGQLGWKPGKADESLIPANRVFIKHGYSRLRRL
jgi:hypothetical protein